MVKWLGGLRQCAFDGSARTFQKSCEPLVGRAKFIVGTSPSVAWRSSTGDTASILNPPESEFVSYSEYQHFSTAVVIVSVHVPLPSATAVNATGSGSTGVGDGGGDDLSSIERRPPLNSAIV